MGARITEIGEHAIAKVLCEKPIEPSDHLGKASMISADYLPHLLGIEARRQHRRVNEVAEHHRELASLGNPRCPDGWDGGERCCGCWLNIPQRSDGIEQPAAVPDRGNTELMQILAREFDAKLPINVVVTERGPIFFEPEHPAGMSGLTLCRAPAVIRRLPSGAARERSFAPDTERFERHTLVNQLGCFLGMKTVLPLMEQSGGAQLSIYHRWLVFADPRCDRVQRHRIHRHWWPPEENPKRRK